MGLGRLDDQLADDAAGSLRNAYQRVPASRTSAKLASIERTSAARKACDFRIFMLSLSNRPRYESGASQVADSTR